MSCSAEEIEKKRQEALQKLASKNKSPFKLVENTPRTFYNNNSPKPKFQFKKLNKYENDKSRANQNQPISKLLEKDSLLTAKFVLVSDIRFGVEVSNFSAPVIDIFKTIPSRNYDSQSRKWSFLINDYTTLISKLKPLRDHLELNELPKFVLNCLRLPKKDLSMIDLSKIDPELSNSLMPFQREGVAFGIDKNGRCLIADDMGLGKTFQALGIASYYRHDWPLLIVTTASMKNTWEETIIQYLPSVPIMKVKYMTTTKDYIQEAQVLIVSHDMLTRAIDALVAKKFGVLIFDESHNFKNFKAKGTQAAMKLTKIAKRVILLSGTPALSRPSELFTQLSFIDAYFFGNFMEYSSRYCDGKSTHFGWDASGQSNLQELEIILARKFMIRRTKDQVFLKLPQKIQEIVSLDVNLNQFSEEDRRCLNALAAKYNSKKGSDRHSILLTFFSETARIKIPSVVSYILQILDTKQKFLLFAHHQIMLDAIAQILKEKNVKFIRIDGNTTSDQRKKYVDKFQQKDDCICALLSITAANAGITLTAANLVIFAELHWNPSILSQAEGRAHRIGQNKDVTIRYLIAPGTADDSIWPMLQQKQKILNEAGLCKDNFNSVEVKNQTNCPDVKLTTGITYKPNKSMDITQYLESPSKKIKINESVVNELNDSFFEHSFKETSENVDVEAMLNDGLDDVFSNIDI